MGAQPQRNFTDGKQNKRRLALNSSTVSGIYILGRAAVQTDSLQTLRRNISFHLHGGEVSKASRERVFSASRSDIITSVALNKKMVMKMGILVINNDRSGVF
jgi:hypothetical protein